MNNSLPYLIVADDSGQIFEIPELRMAGMSADRITTPSSSELIELPTGSNLYNLPGRVPVGFDPETGTFVELPEYNGIKVYAVAAFMAPAYLQIFRSAYTTGKKAPRLPLFCYTAAGWKGGKFYAAGMRIDSDRRQDLDTVDLKKVTANARAMVKKFPQNRLVNHLVENCVFRYGCPAARNFVLGRFECPIPTSRSCNSSCVGCISKQPKASGVVASHDRICFTPTVKEIVEFTVPHLEKAAMPVVSFGQGCEGEPLLEGDLLEESIREIRKQTTRGIVNVNTNGSRPDVVERLCRSGLDSIRVSMNSIQKTFYDRYYRPKNYAFSDVIESLRIVRKHRRWASVNYLMFPGFTDHPAEVAALEGLLDRIDLSMIQTRNLNIDPEWYTAELQLTGLSEEAIGIPAWVRRMRKNHPALKLGYFNPSNETMKPE